MFLLCALIPSWLLSKQLRFHNVSLTTSLQVFLSPLPRCSVISAWQNCGPGWIQLPFFMLHPGYWLHQEKDMQPQPDGLDLGIFAHCYTVLLACLLCLCACFLPWDSAFHPCLTVHCLLLSWRLCFVIFIFVFFLAFSLSPIFASFSFTFKPASLRAPMSIHTS